VMLVETGRRPLYPVGTEINGHDIGSAEAVNNAADTKDSSQLVEKYKDCSLSKIFRDITKDVVTAVEGQAA
jgi:hypothetical protein